jgi:signal transduction histidine kinase
LLSEYRDLKRVSAASADAARAEERISVARRLHDSVGQRLTSLLMQLEVSRLGAVTDEERQRAVDLKRLAQASLDETREAVTALTEDELAGMPALLRLVHNLEVESAMQVEFTIGSGALSVQLDREPAVALYRAVQEALTNAMRHGASRRAKVTVEVPAGRLLRFEVWNEVPRPRRATGSVSTTAVGTDAAASPGAGGDGGAAEGTWQPTFRPGFGLTSMRERVEAAGGQLELVSGSGQFLVRGSFPLEA